MEIGIGLPGMIPGVQRDLLQEWATRSEAAGFSSISTGERLTFGNNDLLVTMAMVAAVTRTIRLMTSVLVLPLHGTGVLAKQIATLDLMSGGRLSLGVGTGGHPADYAHAPVAFADRTATLDRQLAELKTIWAGEQPDDEQIGPRLPPGRPELLLGPSTEKAARRVAQADGLVTFHWIADPEPQQALYDAALDAWQEKGRSGKPRFVAGVFYALGPDAEAQALGFLRTYYSAFPPDQVAQLAEMITTTSDKTVAEAIDRFRDAGADELILCPLIADLDQVDRLAELRDRS